MVNVTHHNLKTVGEAILLANGPGFLFRRLRDDAAVRKIADTFSAEEIVSALKAGADKRPAKVEELALEYALLVALSIMPGKARYVASELQHLELPFIEWSNELKSLVTASFGLNNQYIKRVFRPAMSSPVPSTMGSEVVRRTFSVQTQES